MSISVLAALGATSSLAGKSGTQSLRRLQREINFALTGNEAHDQACLVTGLFV